MIQISVLEGERGRAAGTKAVNEAIDRGMPSTPQNYELWLHVQNNWTPSLTAEIAQFEQTGHDIDAATAEKLYEKHLSSYRLDQTVAHTGAKLAEELTAALETLRSAGLRTEAFTDNLNEAAVALDKNRMDTSQLTSLVRSLSIATKEMTKENSALAERLKTSSAEVDSLRDHLQQVRLEALTDILTGVANRRMFEETLRMRIEESRNLNYPLSLAILDVDFFKLFNDTWGHQTGDQVLRFVASILRANTLDDQLVARYGGEEFAVIFPRLDLHDSLIVVERMRAAVEAKQLRRKSTNEDLGNVTVSAGLAQMHPGETGASLIQRADEMLYRSKQNGRNLVSFWTDKKSAVA